MKTEPSRRDFVRSVAALGVAAASSAGLGPATAPASPRGRASRQTIPLRPIPGTSESLPTIGLGSSKAVLEIPQEGVEPVANVIRMLLEHGGRVVDTSPRTEAIDVEFGRVLQEPDIRDRIFLATKLNTTDAETGISHMRQNQRLFGRRTVDLVQIESLRGLDEHWPRLREWKEMGETRYVGVTVSDYRNHDRLEAFMRSEPLDFVHVNYSVLEPRAEERILPLAQDRGMAVIINRPFTNGTYFGRVSGRQLPEWTADFDCTAWSHFSLKYILAHTAVTCVLTETTNPEHMEENIGAAFGRFPDEVTKRRMRELAQTF